MRHGTVQVRRPEYGADTMVWPPEMLRRPEIRGIDRVALHLDVQGFVVGPEEPRRLALVPTGGLEDAADRVLLGVRRGRVCGLLQRATVKRQLFAEGGRRRRVDGNDREVLRLDHIRGEEDGPANDVPELAHVAWPVIPQQDLSRRF